MSAVANSPYTESLSYDGTNSAAILDYIETFVTAYSAIIGFTIDTEDVTDNIITVIFTNSTGLQLAPGDYLQRNGTVLTSVVGSDYPNLWRTNFGAAAPVADLSIGLVTVPSIAAGSDSSSIPVTLRPGFVDTDYQAVGMIIGGISLLGQLSVTVVSVTNPNTVNVTVHNGALLTVSGGQVLVTAVHN